MTKEEFIDWLQTSTSYEQVTELEWQEPIDSDDIDLYDVLVVANSFVFFKWTIRMFGLYDEIQMDKYEFEDFIDGYETNTLKQQ